MPIEKRREKRAIKMRRFAKVRETAPARSALKIPGRLRISRGDKLRGSGVRPIGHWHLGRERCHQRRVKIGRKHWEVGKEVAVRAVGAVGRLAGRHLEEARD